MGLSVRKKGYGVFMDERRMLNSFPAISDCLCGGKRLIYLDSAATSQRLGCVIEEMKFFSEWQNANPLRGLYGLAEKATERYAEARETVAHFLNAEPEEIVFTRNATEGLNVASLMLAERVRDGDNVVVMLDSHHSNYLPWLNLCELKNAELRVVRKNEDALKLIDAKTRIVSLTHVSNVSGSVYNPRLVCEQAHQYGAVTVLDMAQSVAHMWVDPKSLGADFAVFSGHKMYGPFGIGILLGRKSVLSKMLPVFYGGEMVKSVDEQGFMPADVPHCFEAGTPNVAGAVGLSKAIEWWQKNANYIIPHERAVYEYAEDRLNAFDLVELIGMDDGHTHLGCISFNVPGVHPHDVASMLAEDNICIRAGYLCAQPYLDYVNKGPCCRMSIGAYTTMADIDALIDALRTIRKVTNLGS